MNNIFNQIAESQKKAIIERSLFLDSFINREFSFNNCIYKISGVSENKQNFIFNEVDELSTKTVLNNLIITL